MCKLHSVWTYQRENARDWPCVCVQAKHDSRMANTSQRLPLNPKAVSSSFLLCLFLSDKLNLSQTCSVSFTPRTLRCSGNKCTLLLGTVQ